MAAVEYATQHDDGLRFTKSDIERRKEIVGLEHKDLLHLEAAKPIFTDRAADDAAAFFEYLSRFREAPRLFAQPPMLQDAEVLMCDHLAAMVDGIHFADGPVKAFWVFNSVRKIAVFDMAIIIDFLLDERERTIALQHEPIGELRVLQLHDGLALLPIVGSVDARRARQLTEGLLSAVGSRRASVVVIDVTGAVAINAEVADQLVQAAEAARLIGVVVILSGVSPAVAKTLIDLGVDLSSFDVVGDLQSGGERSEGLLRNNTVPRDGTRA